MNRMTDMLSTQEERQQVAELRALAKTKGAESRAAEEVVKSVLADSYRYSPGMGWLIWDGRRWDNPETATERVVEVVRQFIDTTERELRVEAAEAETEALALLAELMQQVPEDAPRTTRRGRELRDDELVAAHAEKDAVEAWMEANAKADKLATQADIWLNLGSNAAINSVAKLARGFSGILTSSDELDQYPDLLNCQNCVVDLRTGEQLPHQQSLLMTHLAGGDYIPGATDPVWDRALCALDPEVRDWFHFHMGQTVTGHVPDNDALVLSHGGGENGKTSVFLGISRAMGTYARLISHKIFTADAKAHTTELTDLRGLRMALLEETPEAGKLDPHQIKVTVGSEQITARRMRENDITFDTTHTLWITTNHQPIVDATDVGTWRRLLKMPWPYRYRKPHEPIEDQARDRRGDPTLRPYIRNNPDVPTAVLSWLVDGAKRWYDADKISPEPPRAVRNATLEWRKTSNPALKFVLDNLVADEHSYITGPVMRDALNQEVAHIVDGQWGPGIIIDRVTDALSAAGIAYTRSPRTATRIKKDMVESRATPATPPDGIPVRHAHDAPPLPADKVAKVWMGLRFRTAEERAAVAWSADADDEALAE